MTDYVVDKGEAFLDEVFPEWRDAIDVEALDLGDPVYCVAGQTFCSDLMKERYAELYEPYDMYPAYDLACRLVSIREYGTDDVSPQKRMHAMQEYGFEQDWDDGYSYADLQRAWTARIGG